LGAYVEDVDDDERTDEERKEEAAVEALFPTYEEHLRQESEASDREEGETGEQINLDCSASTPSNSEQGRSHSFEELLTLPPSLRESPKYPTTRNGGEPVGQGPMSVIQGVLSWLVAATRRSTVIRDLEVSPSPVNTPAPAQSDQSQLLNSRQWRERAQDAALVYRDLVIATRPFRDVTPQSDQSEDGNFGNSPIGNEEEQPIVAPNNETRDNGAANNADESDGHTPCRSLPNSVEFIRATILLIIDHMLMRKPNSPPGQGALAEVASEAELAEEEIVRDVVNEVLQRSKSRSPNTSSTISSADSLGSVTFGPADPEVFARVLEVIRGPA
jgi:hypothetical protein